MFFSLAAFGNLLMRLRLSYQIFSQPRGFPDSYLPTTTQPTHLNRQIWITRIALVRSSVEEESHQRQPQMRTAENDYANSPSKPSTSIKILTSSRIMSVPLNVDSVSQSTKMTVHISPIHKVASTKRISRAVQQGSKRKVARGLILSPAYRLVW